MTRKGIENQREGRSDVSRELYYGVMMKFFRIFNNNITFVVECKA